MRFSIITPTHTYTPYLYELYESIKAQTYKDWEWVLYLNGSLSKKEVLQEFKDDKRVKIFRYKGEVKDLKVGDAKKRAFSKGKGDILIEVDHDDLITPDCLLELNKAFKRCSCVISDYALLERTVFKTGKRVFLNGKDVEVIESFKPNFKIVLNEWKLPIHLTAWKREFYKKIGGHDENLQIGEDLDILIKTCLKTKIRKVNKPLYIYRRTGQNSFLKFGYDMKRIVINLKTKYKLKEN